MRNPQREAIKNIRGTPSSYSTSTRHEGGAWQTYVTARCSVCNEEYQLHWNTGGADPAFVEKKFRGMGWHFDAFKPKNCVCSDCVNPRNQTWDKLTEELETMATGNKTSTDAVSGYHPPVKGDTAIVSIVNNATGKPNNEPPVPRRLTAHERTKVRTLLDGHFDELKGKYLDGYDDKKVGIECDVPWALVTEIRELAYGPIKEDPEVVAFKAEAKAIRDEVVAMLKNYDAAVDKFQADLKRIEGRLINIEAKAKKL